MDENTGKYNCVTLSVSAPIAVMVKHWADEEKHQHSQIADMLIAIGAVILAPGRLKDAKTLIPKSVLESLQKRFPKEFGKL